MENKDIFFSSSRSKDVEEEKTSFCLFVRSLELELELEGASARRRSFSSDRVRDERVRAFSDLPLPINASLSDLERRR